jgi:D-threo-aldose 1-dehydrogenase
MTGLPAMPQVTLGRTGIISTRFGLGTTNWPHRRSYEEVVEVLQAAFAAGIRHIDLAPLYGTEEIIGRGLKDAAAPPDIVLATKVGSYKDDLGIIYREYSDRTVYRSVERSLKRLQVDYLPIVLIHDCEPEDLSRIFARNGAVAALLNLKHQGVIGSIGIATYSPECLQAAIQSGDIDHIQAYHTYTLLNPAGKEEAFLAARAKNLSVLNCAPYAGWILQSGAVPEAMYNYRPAQPAVIEAVRRLEEGCAQKGISLSTAALAFSLLDPDIDVTIVSASSPERLRDRVKALAAPLTARDFEELLLAAQGPFPISPPYGANPVNL